MGRPTGVGQQNPCLRLCHGPDVLSGHLIGLYFDATAPDAQPERRGSDGKWSRSVALPRGMPPPSDESRGLGAGVLQAFPSLVISNFKFAMVEDLMNSTYPAWLAERGEAWDGPLVPRIGDGCRAGARTHRAALPPRFPFNLEPDEHFQRALQRAQQPLPHEDIPVTDLDLQFVASGYTVDCSTVDGKPWRPWRQRPVGALKEFKRRWGGDPPFEKLPRAGNPTSDQAA